MEQQENPCCVELKKKCAKLEEGRKSLRKALQLLELHANDLQSQNLQLKQELEVERGRADAEKGNRQNESIARKELEEELKNYKLRLLSSEKEKDGESTGRIRLQNELSKLKSEISSLRQEKCKSMSGIDAELLATRAVDAEAEVKRLRKLLCEETKIRELEKRKADMEKKKSSEAWAVAETEKKNAEEERKSGEAWKRKLEELNILLEKTRAEMENARAELTLVKNQVKNAIKEAEMEKLKAEREKKNAETERLKAEASRKASEAEKKKAMEEKIHSDHLRQQLKDECQRREYLEKEVAKKIHTEKRCRHHHMSGDSVEAENVKVKILKESLKLEKKHVRCVTKFAKIQEAEKRLLWQEFNSLKQNFSHVIQHLNMIDYILLCNPGSIGYLSKLGNSNHEGLNGEHSSACHNLHFRNEIIRAQLKNICSFNCSGVAKEDTGPLHSDLGVNRSHHRGSGINSTPESPTGDSLGNMKLNSIASFTAASFSDGKFVGSQERGQSLTAPSTALRCRSASKICGKFPQGKHIGSLLEKNGGAPIVAEDISINPPVYDAVGPNDKGHVRKKRRTGSMPGSVAQLCSKNKKLNGETEVNHLALDDFVLERRLAENDDLFNSKNNKGVFLSGMPNDKQVSKWTKSKGNKSRKQSSCSKFIKQKKSVTEIASRALPSNSLVECELPSNQPLEKDDACPHNTNSILDMENLNTWSSLFEDMANGNIMKIFELDNDSDEERYRAAVARPLSPTLPVLKVARENLLEKVHVMEIEPSESNVFFPDSLDAIDLNVDQKKQKTRCYDLSRRVKPQGTAMEYSDPLSYGDLSIDPDIMCLEVIPISQQSEGKKSKMVYCGSVNFGETQTSSINIARSDPIHEGNQSNDANLVINDTHHPGFSAHGVVFPKLKATDQSLATGLTVEVTSNCCAPPQNLVLNEVNRLSSDDAVECNLGSLIMEFGSSGTMSSAKGKSFNGYEHPAEGKAFNGYENGQPFSFSILYFARKDAKSMCRMLSSLSAIAYQMSLVERNENNLRKILVVSLDAELQPEEKLCILLSVLLDHYCVLLSPTPESTYSGNMFLESYQTEIQNVISEAGIKQLFLDACKMKKLLYLIEDLLFSREVLICTQVQKSSLNSSISKSNVYHLDDADVEICTHSASYNQLAAASLILASLCSMLNNVDFLQEVSCNIILSSHEDVASMLMVLHIFASVCGVDYFLTNENSILNIVIQCAVMLLESSHNGADSSVHLMTEDSSNPIFCHKCPFANKVIATDNVIEILLTKLEEHIKLGLVHEYQSSLPLNSGVVIQGLHFTSETIFDGKTPLSSQDNCSSGALIKENNALSRCSDLFVEENFSGFMETVSFLEMIGCHLDWCRICEKILPRLLKLSESCPDEGYSVLLVLIGKLGRLGVRAGGYAQDSLAGLRAFLCRYLDLSACKNDNLPLQFAAFEALLDLLPVDSREIVTRDHEIVNAKRDESFQYKSMRAWFSQLSEKHRELLCRSTPNR